MKKLLSWAALGIAVLWVVNNPAQAAALVHQIGHAITVITRS